MAFISHIDTGMSSAQERKAQKEAYLAKIKAQKAAAAVAPAQQPPSAVSASGPGLTPSAKPAIPMLPMASAWSDAEPDPALSARNEKWESQKRQRAQAQAQTGSSSGGSSNTKETDAAARSAAMRAEMGRPSQQAHAQAGLGGGGGSATHDTVDLRQWKREGYPNE